jgi:FkbM family methyltransferase
MVTFRFWRRSLGKFWRIRADQTPKCPFGQHRRLPLKALVGNYSQCIRRQSVALRLKHRAVLAKTRRAPAILARRMEVRWLRLLASSTHGWKLKRCTGIDLHLLLNTDNYIDYLIYRRGVYEYDTLLTISSLLGMGLQNFVDVGSNIGLMSLFVARHSPDVRVVSFEPVPDNIAQQRTNMLLNDVRYELVERALSDSDGDLTLYLGKRGNRAVDFGKYNSGMPSVVLDEYRDARSALQVRATTLDAALASLVPEFDAGGGTLVKIDVEGAEQGVLSGMLGLLENLGPVALVVELLFERNGSSCVAVETLLRDRGFEMRGLNMAILSPLGSRRSGTYLFLRGL